VRTHRQRRGLTHRQLSAQLAEVGHPILPSGIAKIEDGSRRVDVDDLVALSLALRVPLSRLLLPGKDTSKPVALTEKISLGFTEAWRWARGELLPGDPPEPDKDGDGWVTVNPELGRFISLGHPDLFDRESMSIDVYHSRLSAVLHAPVAEIDFDGGIVRFRGPRKRTEKEED
jgi:hypothetical protein